MNPRLAAIATLCRRTATPACLVVGLAALGPAAPFADHPSWSVVAVANAAEKPQPIGVQKASAATVDDTTTTLHEAEPALKAASTDPSDTPPPESPLRQTTVERTANLGPADTRPPVDSTMVLDECFDVNACVDRYLWALYQRTPKEDTIKEEERTRVTVKKKGKMVTVTRTVTKLIDEDFTWKDGKAADHARMAMMDYVVGGVDRSFKLRLFHLLHAADEAGLSPGITSAFRDDYRQSIASGLKAASNRSYHGGSSHGGYGHGLAADIVSVRGETRDQRWASSEVLWKWIDAHGPTFGIGRPYLDRDPAHLAPIDGKEYADHRGGAKTRQANAHHGLAARNHAAVKHAKDGASSKPRAS